MATTKEVSKEVFSFIRQYKDGTIERLAGTQVISAGMDSQTGVLSKDVVIAPENNVSARLYRPNAVNDNQKLPLLVYFHGGGFCISSAAEPMYHNSMNQLVAEANIIVVSVDYRLAPEHPLPTAYEDSWSALHWVADHVKKADGHEPWLEDYVDFGRVFLAGDSAGANIIHHLTLRVKDYSELDLGKRLKFQGLVMIHPYFWGKNPIGIEIKDYRRKSTIDKWWMFVCPSDKGSDDPYINPFVEGSPSLESLACDRVLVFVAEKDILSDRGKLYYENLVKSGWRGKAEMVETKGEDHVFHVFNPNCDSARLMIKKWASFLNQP